MKRCDFAQVGIIRPVLDGLKFSGVAIEPVKLRTGIASLDLDNNENYLPFALVDNFLAQVEQDQGIVSLAAEFKSLIDLSICLEWGEMISACPSFFSAARSAEKQSDIVFTNEDIRIRINGNVTKYEQRLSNVDVESGSPLVDINTALLFNVVRAYFGDEWAPKEIHFQSKTALDLDLFFPASRETKIYTGMPSTAILMDTELACKAKQSSGAIDDNAVDRLFFSPRTYIHYVESILKSSRDGVVPTIMEAAGYMNLSERTLRRGLASQATSYEELVDNWRFNEALLKISNPTIELAEIGAYLGYSYAPNFIRAFKRWTNVTPSKYREMIAAD